MATLNWHIGCSGFYYKEWKEVFYPKGLAPNRWLDYYCQHFNTLEVNNTFYRFPQLPALESWYHKSPPGFTFAVKVTRTITHQQQFEGSYDLLHQFYSVVRFGLKEKLGPVLFQLPHQLHYSPEKLKDIIRLLDPTLTNVLEFRHISWWRREVMDLLEQNCLTFCGVSYPGLITDAVVNTPTAYYRFHGVPHLYHSSYETDFLQQVIRQITSGGKTQSAYLYFNNTAAAAALANAKTAQQLVASNS